jgi:LmbE family N-acetylglucosaminyl deacetylase
MNYLQQLEQLNTIDDLKAMPIEHILVIVAHPHDIELWCGGTICRFTDAGKQVAYVLFTSRRKGTAGKATVTPQERAAMHELEELVAAARILGVASVTLLDWPESDIEPAIALRRELIPQIRLFRPDLVVTHDPAPPYRPHPDHRALGSATLDALTYSAQNPLPFAGQIQEEDLLTHTVPEAWLFATKVSDLWIDITATLERKITARLAHTSEFTDAIALRRYWHERAARIGKPAGLEAAEAFKQVDLR